METDNSHGSWNPRMQNVNGSEIILGTCSAHFQIDLKDIKNLKSNYDSSLAYIINLKYVLSVKLQEVMHNIYTPSVNEFTLSINLSLVCTIQALEA